MGRGAFAFTHTGVCELLVYQKIRLTEKKEGQPPTSAWFAEAAAEFAEELEFDKKSFCKKDKGAARVVALFFQTSHIKGQRARVGVAAFLKFFEFGRIPFKHFNFT
jgi:hypothetical protein